MGKSRDTANLISDINIFSNISNDRVGIGTTNPTTKLQVSGEITCIDINSTSDLNLKNNIQSLDNALEIISNLRGVRFQWKSNNKKSIGIIAQELEEELPELVTNTNPKTVNYNGLIGVMIEAIKEQNNIITKLCLDIENIKRSIG